MVSALGWIPAGVSYTLSGSDEFLAFVRESGSRMSRACAVAAG